MTRVLSELLGSKGLDFSIGIQKLEQASGHDSTDIRLSTDVLHAVQRKLKELGLDSHDTTGTELYNALGVRLLADEKRLFSKLESKYNSSDPIANIASELNSLPIPMQSFALKSVVAKRLLKKNPPKKAIKLLGYRSFDSMLKHESAAAIYAVCMLSESQTWYKQLIESYKKLQ